MKPLLDENKFPKNQPENGRLVLFLRLAAVVYIGVYFLFIHPSQSDPAVIALLVSWLYFVWSFLKFDPKNISFEQGFIFLLGLFSWMILFMYVEQTTGSFSRSLAERRIPIPIVISLSITATLLRLTTKTDLDSPQSAEKLKISRLPVLAFGVVFGLILFILFCFGFGYLHSLRPGPDMLPSYNEPPTPTTNLNRKLPRADETWNTNCRFTPGAEENLPEGMTCVQSSTARCILFPDGNPYLCQFLDSPRFTHKLNQWGSSLTVTDYDTDNRPLTENYYADGKLESMTDYDYKNNIKSVLYLDSNQTRLYQYLLPDGRVLNKFYFRPGKPYVHYPDGNDMAEINGPWEEKDGQIFLDGRSFWPLPQSTAAPDTCEVFKGACAQEAYATLPPPLPLTEEEFIQEKQKILAKVFPEEESRRLSRIFAEVRKQPITDEQGKKLSPFMDPITLQVARALHTQLREFQQAAEKYHIPPDVWQETQRQLNQLGEENNRRHQAMEEYQKRQQTMKYMPNGSVPGAARQRASANPVS